MGDRILGLDVARAFAIFGMVIVNFKLVIGENIYSGADYWVKVVGNIIDGKASAVFVMLAGIGVAVGHQKARQSNSAQLLSAARWKLCKRAIVLFVVGLAYMPIWPADILHFYGVYMSILAILMKRSTATILSIAALFILIFPLLMMVVDYERNWDFSTMTYENFWTVHGFICHLFFNGFHPAIPWASFMLVGYWFGQQDLHDDRWVNKVLTASLAMFVAMQCLSIFLMRWLVNADPQSAEDIASLFGTSPMPPLPIYMVSGIAIALSIICCCIQLSKCYGQLPLVKGLAKTGQLSLTLYVAHVILGIGMLEAINPDKLGHYSRGFSLVYALAFCLLSFCFAIMWRQYFRSGPVEWLLRKIAN